MWAGNEGLRGVGPLRLTFRIRLTQWGSKGIFIGWFKCSASVLTGASWWLLWWGSTWWYRRAVLWNYWLRYPRQEREEKVGWGCATFVPLCGSLIIWLVGCARYDYVGCIRLWAYHLLIFISVLTVYQILPCLYRLVKFPILVLLSVLFLLTCFLASFLYVPVISNSLPSAFLICTVIFRSASSIFPYQPSPILAIIFW